MPGRRVITMDSVLQARDGLVVEAFDDAVLVWDNESGRLHHLDIRAALVWEELDGRTLGEIADELARLFAADSRSVRDDLLTLSHNLLTERLVVIATA